MRVLLDTHAFVWYSLRELEQFRKMSLALWRDPAVELLLSPVSIIEMAIKSNGKSLDMTADDVRSSLEAMNVIILPQDERHALRMFSLPMYHKGPFDRMLIATALSEDVPFMSRDKSVKYYRKAGLPIVW